MIQYHPNKTPFRMVICLFQIYFFHHVPITSFPLFYRVDQLLSSYHIVSTPSTSKESSLHWRNQGVQQWSQSLNQYFSQNFVHCVAQTNGSIFTNGFRATLFWNQSNQSLVSVLLNLFAREKILNYLSDRITNNYPKCKPSTPGTLKGFMGIKASHISFSERQSTMELASSLERIAHQPLSQTE